MKIKFKNPLIVIVSVLLLSYVTVSLQSCQQDFMTNNENVIPFPDDVSAIFTEPLDQTNITCSSPSCHSNQNPQNGLNLVDWKKTMFGSDNGTVVIPYSSEWSFFTSVLSSDTSAGPVTDVALPQYHKIDTAIAGGDRKLQVLKNWIDAGAKNKNGGIAYEFLSAKTFILNQQADAVAVLNNDPAYFLVTRMIPVGEGVGLASPHYIEISPDQGYFYVSLIAGGYVEKYNVNVDFPFPRAGRINAGTSPAHIVISPDNQTGYVTNFDAGTSGTESGVTKFNANTMAQNSVERLYDLRMWGTHGMALSANGEYLYVASQVGEYMYKIKTSDFSIERMQGIDPSVPPTGGGTGLFRPYQIVMSPDQQYLFVSLNGPSGNPGNDKVRILKASDLTFVKDIEVGNNPILMKFTPNGRYLFVCNKNKNTGDKYTVSVIETAGQTLYRTIEDVGIQPHGVDFTPFGDHAIISCETLAGFDGHHPIVGSKKVGVTRIIRVADMSLLDIRIQMGSFPSGIATLK